MIENESLLDRQVNPDPPKDNRRKLKKIFIAIVFGLGAFAGIYGYSLNAERAAEMADVYGGKTPAETLQMFIDALKQGDYALASKYCVLDMQQGELNILNKNSPKKELMTRYIQMLEEASKQAGTYSPDGKTFLMNSELSTINYRMILYPSGVWKIDAL